MPDTADDHYAFRHPVTRDGAYQLMPPSDRSRFHIAAADLLEAASGETSSAEAIARHLLAAHELSPDASLAVRTHAACMTAADELHAGFRTAEAVRLLLAVYDAPDAGEDLVIDAATRAATLCVIVGRCAEGERLALDAIARMDVRGERSERRCMAVAAAGSNAWAVGHFDSAEVRLRESIETAGRDGYTVVETKSLNDLGLLLQATGRREEAVRHLTRALDLARRTNDLRGIGVAAGNLGMAQSSVGNAAEAMRGYEEALAIAREQGNRRSESIWTSNIANLRFADGDFAAAEKGFRAAIALARSSGNTRTEGVAMGNLANVLRRTGRLAEAEAALHAALGLHRAVANLRFEGLDLKRLGDVLAELSRPEDALEAFRRAAAILRTVRDRHEEAVTLKAHAAVLDRIDSPLAASERTVVAQRLASLESPAAAQDRATA